MEAKYLILNGDEYREVSSKDFEKYRATEKENSFLRIGNIVFETTKEDYKAHYREKERLRYLEKERKRVKEMSFSKDNENLIHQKLGNHGENIEDVVITKLQIEKLRRALGELNAEEQKLVELLYFAEKSESQTAKILGISKQIVNRKKRKVLFKMKKFIKK